MDFLIEGEAEKIPFDEASLDVVFNIS